MQTVRVLWFALLPSNFVFAALLTNGFAARQRTPDVGAMSAVFGALALGIAVLAFVLPARLFAKAIAAMRIDVAEEAGETPGGFRQAAVVTRRIAHPTEALLAALARWQPAFIVGMALAESISLFGFVLGFLGAPPTTYFAFIATGLTIMLLKFPQIGTVKSAVERASGATFKP